VFEAVAAKMLKHWRHFVPICLVAYVVLIWVWALSGYPTDAVTALDKLNSYGVLITAIATAFIAWFTWTLRQSTEKLFVTGERTAEIAEKALVAANRPWVKVDIQVGGPIFYNENGANFTLRFVMKNIGHSPATNVWPSSRVIFPVISETTPRNFDPRGEMQKDIAHLKTRPPSPFGFALFPDDIIIQDITMTMSRDDIKRATELIEAIYPTVIGAVDYRMGFDEKSHQTGFIVQIKRNNAPRPATTAKNRAPEAIWLDEGDVPAEDVRLFRSFIDGGFAD
jgi:hypothetical protein